MSTHVSSSIYIYVQLFCGARDIKVWPEVYLWRNFLCTNREGSEYAEWVLDILPKIYKSPRNISYRVSLVSHIKNQREITDLPLSLSFCLFHVCLLFYVAEMDYG